MSPWLFAWHLLRLIVVWLVVILAVFAGVWFVLAVLADAVRSVLEETRHEKTDPLAVGRRNRVADRRTPPEDPS